MFITKIRAGTDDRSAWGDFWFEPVGGRTSSGTTVTPDGALHLPVVIACVRVLAESFAVLPLRVYRRRGGAKKLLNKHWLYDVLARRPNEYQTPFEWREMIQGHLALRGNAYNRILTDRSGQITGFMPLHPDRVRVEYTTGRGDLGHRYRYTDRAGNTTVFTRGEIWHLRGLASDGVMGLSPIALARESVGLGLAAQTYGARFFQNDAKPGGGWIEFPGSFKDKEAREQFRESFQAAHTGLNQHKISVLEFGMKFHEVGVTNKDSQFLEARQFQVGDIARIFRVPPHLVGDLSKATFSNIEQPSLDFVIHTMTPWAERWESSIESTLLLDDEQDIEVEFDFTGLLRGDQQARSAYYHNGIMDGWMTRNEARIAEGHEPIDGLDEPLRPLNMVEESNAGAPPPASDKPTVPGGDPQPAPNDGKGSDARTVALASAAAERIARKELAIVASASGHDAMEQSYQAHARFVAQALGVEPEAARGYCDLQLQLAFTGTPAADFELITRSRLERLALRG